MSGTYGSKDQAIASSFNSYTKVAAYSMKFGANPTKVTQDCKNVLYDVLGAIDKFKDSQRHWVSIQKGCECECC